MDATLRFGQITDAFQVIDITHKLYLPYEPCAALQWRSLCRRCYYVLRSSSDNLQCPPHLLADFKVLILQVRFCFFVYKSSNKELSPKRFLDLWEKCWVLFTEMVSTLCLEHKVPAWTRNRHSVLSPAAGINPPGCSSESEALAPRHPGQAPTPTIHQGTLTPPHSQALFL